MSNKHTKRCSISLVIREMQIQTAVRNHYASARMTILKKRQTDNIKCWQECGEPGTSRYCWWGKKMIQPLWITDWHFPKKLNINLTWNTTIHCYALLKRKESICPKIYMWMFIVEFFIIAQNSKQPKCRSADERINKTWFTHTMEFYSAMKRTQVLIHAMIWKNLKNVC